MVFFNHVSKIYDTKIAAVEDVTFKVEEGEFVFLIGPSGSGKTTIIKMLIRDEMPSAGQVYFNDKDITKITRKSVYKLRREVGVIFQDFKLVNDKTAYENVSFAMEAAGKKNREIKETVPYVLDIVGLSHRINAFPRQLSGGEQQRVAIARAIANNPKILIADEPTGNLDPASSWDIVQVLTKINNWGTTVIMSTHGTDIVNSLNKRVIQMEAGKVIRDDNKGQYELTQVYEEDILNKVEKEKPGKKVAKPKQKQHYEIKISKEDTAGDEVVPEAKPNFWSKIFKKSTLVKSAEDEVSPQPEQSTKPESEKQAEAENSAKEASDKESAKQEEKSDAFDLSEFMDEAAKIDIEKLDLKKEIKADLKSAGYNNIGDLINAGPEGLSKNLIIDPEEVVLVSKEIKRFLEAQHT